MDPVSTTASVIAMLQITAAVISACNQYRLSVKQAPQEVESIVSELNSLTIVLEQVLAVAKEEEKGGASDRFSLTKLTAPGKALQMCLENLTSLQQKLLVREGWRGVKDSLTWHFKADEIRKTLGQISSAKETLNLSITTDSALVSLRLQNDVAVLAQSFNAVKISGKQQMALDWLGASSFFEKQNAARRKYKVDTGKWFTEGDKFKAWRTTPQSAMWLHGIPGCGKTILCSAVIELLDQHRKVTPQTNLAYFYFDFNNAQQSDLISLLRSLVTQLAMQHESSSVLLVKQWMSSDEGRRPPTTAILTDLLAEMLRLCNNVFVAVDALDECRNRDELLDWIDEFSHLDLPSTHILYTSRKENDIDEVMSSLAIMPVSTLGSDVDPDIRLYIRDRLQRERKLQKWPSTTKDEIEETLMSRVSGMFRMAECQLDMLCKCNNLVMLRKELQSLPRTLEGTYDRILLEIDESHIQDAVKVLQWLSFSARPLLLTEVVEILAIDDRHNHAFNPDLRYADPKDVLTICSSLVSVRSRKISRGLLPGRREEVDELHLAHFSVKEYLISDRIVKGPVSHFRMKHQVVASSMTDNCIIYLTQPQFTGYRHLRRRNIKDYPFAPYAARYWSTHAAVQDPAHPPAYNQERIISMLSNTELCRNWISLSNPDATVSYASDLEHIDLQEAINDKEIRAPLYYACLFGLFDIAKTIFSKNTKPPDFNEVGGEAGTVLHAAALSGNLNLIKFLLEQGADVNAIGGEWQTVLQAAAEAGHDAAVQLLLQHGADPSIEGGFHGSALQAACYRGSLSSVRILLENGANPDLASGFRGLALAAAAERGHEEIIELLISRGVNINFVHDFDKPALHQAARKGPLRIVKLLVAKGADINLQDHYGGSPLREAVSGNQVDIVEWLLRQGADPNIGDISSGTPLSTASEYGRETIVQLLLQFGADVNGRMGEVGTPLEGAARGGHLHIMEILLPHGADPTIGFPLRSAMSPTWPEKDSDSTSLSTSARKLLIAQKLIDHGANVNEYGGEYAYPLQAAALDGNLEFVEFLVKNGADIDARGGTYGTALQAAFASTNHSTKVAEYLLEQGADVNARGGIYGSPLNAAAHNERGDVAFVELALKNGADVRARCEEYLTALHAAIEAGNLKISKVLLDAGADIEARSERFETPLYCAIRNDHAAIAELLLDRGAVHNSRHDEHNDLHGASVVGMLAVIKRLLVLGADVNGMGSEHDTALHAASVEGKSNAIALLLRHGADPNLAKPTYDDDDRHRELPLHVAAQSESLRAVQLLVQAGADIHRTGGFDHTVLQAAASAGEFKTVQYLLSLGADVNVEGGHYHTALQAGAYEGNRNILKALLDAGANVNAQGGEFGNALQAAAQSFGENLATTKILLEAGADPTIRGGRYGFALQAAAQEGTLTTVKLLVQAGADINARGGEYGTALLAAAHEGRVSVAKYLLTEGADPYVTGPQGSLLYHAAYSGNVTLIQMALDFGIDIDSGWGEEGSSLKVAIHSGSVKAVKLLLDRGINVHEDCGAKESALLEALWQEDCGVLQMLLKAGVDLNTQFPEEGRWVKGSEWSDTGENTTPASNRDSAHLTDEDTVDLEAAAVAQEEDTISQYSFSNSSTTELEADDETNTPKYLNALLKVLKEDDEGKRQLVLSKTTDVNAPGGEYGNALQGAMIHCHIGFVRQLLDRGADVHAIGGKFHTILQAAATTGDLKRVELVLSFNPDVNLAGGEWGTALQAASQGGFVDIVDCLTQRGADVNVTGGKHFTPLQAAAVNGHLKTVELLLAKGADVNIHDQSKGDALQAAAAQGQLEVVQMLHAHGAIADRTSDKYENAIQAATNGGFVRVIRFLARKYPDLIYNGMWSKAHLSLKKSRHDQLAKKLDVQVFIESCGLESDP